MNRAPLIVSAGIADARLSDPVWASEMIALADQARIALLLLGDGHAAPFDPLAVAGWLAPRAGSVGLVPTIDTGRDLTADVARALAALGELTEGRAGWQPSTLVQATTGESVAHGAAFVAAMRSLWAHEENADAAQGIDGREGDGEGEGEGEGKGTGGGGGGGDRGDDVSLLAVAHLVLPNAHVRPVLVQTDADPLWSQVAADVVIIDMDSPKPPAGPKCLLRTYTALAGLDQIEGLYHDGIIDGIHLTPPYPRRGLQEFADTMLPALIERGLLPHTRGSGTLRERLGLGAGIA